MLGQERPRSDGFTQQVGYVVHDGQEAGGWHAPELAQRTLCSAAGISIPLDRCRTIPQVWQGCIAIITTLPVEIRSVRSPVQCPRPQLAVPMHEVCGRIASTWPAAGLWCMAWADPPAPRAHRTGLSTTLLAPASHLQRSHSPDFHRILQEVAL